MSYSVPGGEFENEYVIKKSRFIARLIPVSDRADVMAAVDRAKLDYPDARHHCWAYLLGKPSDASNAGMNDDGEPSGTAGKPILNVLQHGHLGDVLVVVIRYFGGIKLGAGGLVRAYGTATQQALDLAPSVLVRNLQQFWVELDFSQEQSLRHFLQGIGGEVVEIQYADCVRCQLSIAQEQELALTDFCAAHQLRLRENAH